MNLGVLFLPHISELIRIYLSLSDLFHLMPSGFIHAVANGNIIFIWLNNISVCGILSHNFLSIHPSMDTHVVFMSWLL